MQMITRWRPGVHPVAVHAVTLGLLAVLAAGSAAAQEWMLVKPHHGVFFVEQEDLAARAAKQIAPDQTLTVNGLTWNVTYADNGVGFNDPALGANRRALFENALTYIANVLNENATIDVEVEPSQLDGSGFLASAGTFYPVGVPGFFDGTTLERVKSGIKPAPQLPEILVTVDFGFNWNESTAPPANNEFDLLSTIVHELTHGLGFLSLGDAVGGNCTYAALDRFIVRGTPRRNLFGGTPTSFIGQQQDLTSNDLFYSGAQGTALYGQGVEAGIFAPSPFLNGSTLSHWDTGNIVGGAVMEHAIAPGEAVREYAPLEIGALRDLGYVNAATPQQGGFTLAVSTSGQGTVTRSPNQTTYAPGTVVTLTAAPAAGFTFTNWVGNVADVNSPATTITMNQNEEVTAVFTATNPALTINVQGQGTVSASPPGPTYTPGTVVTLTASPAPGAAFNSWVGNVSNTLNPVTTITMNQNEEVTAVFTQQLPPALAAFPANRNIDFGELAIGMTEVATLTVSNTGGGTLTGSAVEGSPAYNILGNANFSLSPGQSQGIQLQFAPTEAGVANTVVVLNSNGGSVQFNVTGTGAGTLAACGGGSGGAANPWGDVAIVLGVAGGLLLLTQRRRLALRPYRY